MKRTIWGSVLLVLVPCLAWAQRPQDSWDNLKQLQAGEKIEVVDMKLKLYKGTFAGLSEEAISVRAKQGEVVIERANVLRVNSGHAKRGRHALIGLAIGAGAGLAVGALLDRQATGEFKDFGVILGPPIGAGVGGLVGAAMPAGQKTLYRARQRTRAALGQTLSGSSR